MNLPAHESSAGKTIGRAAFAPLDLRAFDADPSRGYRDGMGSDHIGSTLGLRLRRERFRREMSLSDVAKRAGIAKSYLKKIEDGYVANPGICTLASLCIAIDYRLSDLVKDIIDGAA